MSLPQPSSHVTTSKPNFTPIYYMKCYIYNGCALLEDDP